MPTHPSRRLRIGVPAAILTAIALLVGGLSAPAFAAGSSVSGVIRDADGVPLQGIKVELAQKSGSAVTATDPAAVPPATTAADGSFSLGSVPDGTTYTLIFSGSPYATAYFAGAGAAATTTAANAATFSVAGAAVSGLNSTLSAYADADVTGSVSAGGQPLSGATIDVGTVSGSTFTAISPAKAARSAADGSFTIADVPAGTYVIRYRSDAYADAYYAGAGQNATTSPGAATQTTLKGTNVALGTAKLVTVKAGTVSGGLTDSSSQPVSGATVTLVAAGGSDTSSTATTGSDGSYSITGVPAGNYRVKFTSPRYVTSYFAGAGSAAVTDVANASSISVSGNGTTSGISSLLPAATVTGTVTDGSTGIKGVTVTFETSQLGSDGKVTYTSVGSATTGNDGTYSLKLPARDYTVTFSSSGYQTAYWKSASATSTTKSEATGAFKPTGGGSTAANATLTLLNGVSGTVKDAQGNLLSGTDVHLVKYDTTTRTWADVTNLAAAGSSVLTTGTDGRYVVNLTNAGIGKSFRLEFEPADSARSTIYYPSAVVPDEAQNITVQSGQSLTGYNVVLPKLSLLAGTVSEANGSATNASGTLSAWRQVSTTTNGDAGGASTTRWQQVGASANLSNGSFRLLLPAGSYRLRADIGDDEGFLPNLVGLDDAPDIKLSAEQSLTGQNYLLPSRQNIRGNVTDASGNPIPGVKVQWAYSVVTNVVDGVAQRSNVLSTVSTSASDGSYVLPARSRNYLVFGTYSPSGGAAQVSYYPFPATTATDASTVGVSGSDVSGIDLRFGTDGVLNLERSWISGDAKSGSTLTANPGKWSRSDLSFRYQWQFNKNPTTSNVWTDVTSSQGTVSSDGTKLTLSSCGIIPIGCSNDYAAAYQVVVTPVLPGSGGGQGTPVDSAKSTSQRTGVAVASNATAPLENRRVPIVSGRPVVAGTLSSDTGKWTGSPTFTYQWFAGGSTIQGATAATYSPTASVAGLVVKVRVTATSGSSVVTADSDGVTVGGGSISNVTAPTLSGSPLVNQTLTVNPGTWSVPSPTLRYVWLANGQVIPGATGTTFKLTDDQIGTQIVVQVTATAPSQGSATKATAPTAVVTEDPNDPTRVVNTAKPSISGIAKVGEVLTASTGSWSNSPTTFGYQWSVSGIAVAGATSSTFAPRGADVGKPVTVTVTASKSGLKSGTATSAATDNVLTGAAKNTAIPVISGLTAIGQTLSTTTGSWTPNAGLGYAYQWRAGGTAIAGATSSQYTITSADLGKQITVIVTATGTGYEPADSTSASVGPVTETATITVSDGPSVSGLPKVGSILNVDTGTTTPADARASVRWLRNGSAISGATGTSYRLVAADAGKFISARVTYTRSGLNTLVKTTDGLGPISGAAESRPQISVSQVQRNGAVVLTITVKGSGKAASGRVKLTEGSKSFGTKYLSGGKVRFSLKGLKAGKHSLKVRFLGSSKVKAGSRTVKVTVRKR